MGNGRTSLFPPPRSYPNPEHEGRGEDRENSYFSHHITTNERLLVFFLPNLYLFRSHEKGEEVAGNINSL